MKIKQIAAVVLTAAMVTAGGAAESADSYKVGWKVTFSLPDNQDSAGFDKNLWEAGGTKIGVAEPTYVVEKCRFKQISRNALEVACDNPAQRG